MVTEAETLLATQTTNPTPYPNIHHQPIHESHPPLNLNLFTLTQTIPTQLSQPMQIIYDGFTRTGWKPPTWPHELTTQTACDWLTEEETLNYWTTHDDYAKQQVTHTTHKIHHQLRRALHIEHDPQAGFIPTCTQTTNGQPCGQPATLNPPGTAFECPNGHTWEYAEAIERLARTQPITATQAAHILNIKTNTIRKWVERAKLHPIGHRGRRPLYTLDDIRHAQGNINV
jgi:hypothetical protein